MLPGTVTNVVPFGAFVDVHVGRDGLIPRAMMNQARAPARPSAPSQHPQQQRGQQQGGQQQQQQQQQQQRIPLELSVGDEVMVEVVEVDAARQRLTLRPAAATA